MSKTLTRQTSTIKASEKTTGWYIIDAKNQVLGRLSTVAARILSGKNKPQYSPGQEIGDHVVIVNAKHVAVTGRKEAKPYYRHSGYPGGLKETDLATLRRTYPDRIVRHAVSGMLPKNRLSSRMIKKLHIFAGDDHDFEDKKPVEVKIG